MKKFKQLYRRYVFIADVICMGLLGLIFSFLPVVQTAVGQLSADDYALFLVVGPFAVLGIYIGLISLPKSDKLKRLRKSRMFGQTFLLLIGFSFIIFGLALASAAVDALKFYLIAAIVVFSYRSVWLLVKTTALLRQDS
jgi:hypothetical protein